MDKSKFLARVVTAALLSGTAFSSAAWWQCSDTGCEVIGYPDPYDVDCPYYGGCDGDYDPWDPPGDHGGDNGGGGGGGTTTPPDLTDRDIPAALECALVEYLHNDVKLTGGKTMKMVNAWAFGRQGANGTWGYEFSSTNSSPGPEWISVGGVGSPGFAYARLYNAAFQATTLPMIVGTRYGVPSNSLFGAMSEFEMSLLVAGHEASHLKIGRAHV